MRAGLGNSASVDGRVLITELSGSESVIHFKVGKETWVSQSLGIHPVEVGSNAQLYVDTDQILYFNPNGELIG